MVNGRGQIELRVDPGNYTVTVQDLEAGVKEYHTESMDFSVPGMNPRFLLNLIIYYAR